MWSPIPQEQIDRLGRLPGSHSVDQQGQRDAPILPSLRVLLFGFHQEVNNWRCEAYQIEAFWETEEFFQSYAKGGVAVIALGPRLTPVEMCSCIARALAEAPDCAMCVLLIGVGPNTELFQPLIDTDHVFYLSRGDLTDAQLWSIVSAAARRAVGTEASIAPERLWSGEPFDANVLDYCDRLSQQVEVSCTGELLTEAVRSVVGADRSEFLIYDWPSESLWSIDSTTRQRRVESAAAGVVGFVARTAEPLQIERLNSDPRFDPEADDSGGSGDVRLVALPIRGSSTRPFGVITAIRNRAAPAFSPREIRLTELLAASAGAALSVTLLHERLQRLIADQARPDVGEDVFRREAVNHFSRSWDEEGEVLKGPPIWLRRTHWVALGLLLAGLLFLVFARVEERATGPALIQARSKTAVVAATSGFVRSVEVFAGDEVKAGDLLVSYEDVLWSKTFEGLNRQLRAPRDGVVSEVRVRPGQQIAPGDQVASIVEETSGYELVVLLPGGYASQLRSGLRIVFTIDGYSESHQVIGVDHVGKTILSAREALRYVGGDSLAVAGPVVVVRSILPTVSFGVGGRIHAYHEGMTAAAEITVQSEPMIVGLIPGLKRLFSGSK